MKICEAYFTLLFTFCLGDGSPSQNQYNQQLSAYSPDGQYQGVASIAGVANRNGRVSTIGSVSFLPGPAISVTAGEPTHWFYPWIRQTTPANYLGHNAFYDRTKAQFPSTDSFTPYALNKPEITNDVFNTLSSSATRLDAIRSPWFGRQYLENLVRPEVRPNYIRRNFMPYSTGFYDPFPYFW